MTAITQAASGASTYSQGINSRYFHPIDLGAATSGPEDDEAKSWDLLIDDLLRIRKLEEGWDEGSAVPEESLVDGAIKLAQGFKASKFAPADRVVAGPNGTIFFEWFGDKSYHEIEVVTPHMFELRILEDGSDVPTIARISHPL